MKSTGYEEKMLKLIGQKIRMLRTQERLSQVQLADSLGISARYLSEIEAGKRNLSFGILCAISNYLAIPLHELLNLEPPQAREDAIKQITCRLETMSLSHLQFIQRAIRQFME